MSFLLKVPCCYSCGVAFSRLEALKHIEQPITRYSHWRKHCMRMTLIFWFFSLLVELILVVHMIMNWREELDIYPAELHKVFIPPIFANLAIEVCTYAVRVISFFLCLYWSFASGVKHKQAIRVVGMCWLAMLLFSPFLYNVLPIGGFVRDAYLQQHMCSTTLFSISSLGPPARMAFYHQANYVGERPLGTVFAVPPPTVMNYKPTSILAALEGWEGTRWCWQHSDRWQDIIFGRGTRSTNFAGLGERNHHGGLTQAMLTHLATASNGTIDPVGCGMEQSMAEAIPDSHMSLAELDGIQSSLSLLDSMREGSVLDRWRLFKEMNHIEGHPEIASPHHHPSRGRDSSSSRALPDVTTSVVGGKQEWGQQDGPSAAKRRAQLIRREVEQVSSKQGLGLLVDLDEVKGSSSIEEKEGEESSASVQRRKRASGANHFIGRDSNTQGISERRSHVDIGEVTSELPSPNPQSYFCTARQVTKMSGLLAMVIPVGAKLIYGFLVSYQVLAELFLGMFSVKTGLESGIYNTRTFLHNTSLPGYVYGLCIICTVPPMLIFQAFIVQQSSSFGLAFAFTCMAVSHILPLRIAYLFTKMSAKDFESDKNKRKKQVEQYERLSHRFQFLFFLGLFFALCGWLWTFANEAGDRIDFSRAWRKMRKLTGLVMRWRMVVVMMTRLLYMRWLSAVASTDLLMYMIFDAGDDMISFKEKGKQEVDFKTIMNEWRVHLGQTELEEDQGEQLLHGKGPPKPKAKAAEKKGDSVTSKAAAGAVKAAKTAASAASAGVDAARDISENVMEKMEAAADMREEAAETLENVREQAASAASDALRRLHLPRGRGSQGTRENKPKPDKEGSA